MPGLVKPKKKKTTKSAVVTGSTDPLVRAYNLLAQITDDEREEAEENGEPMAIDADADLVLAAYAGDVVRAKRALDAGASPDARQSGTGYPALVLAVSNGHTKIVRSLLEHGADANAEADVKIGRKKQTVTALMRAEAEGKTSIAKLLREHGAG